MPLPFILAGAAAIAGITGIAKGAEAMSKNSEAKELLEEAQDIFESAKYEMEQCKEEAADSLADLGKLKLEIWDRQFNRFINLVERVKNVDFEGQAAIDNKLYSRITKEDLMEMKEISLKAGEVVAGGFTSLGAGALAGIASYGGAMMFASASTGTAISALSGVAATNATLAWFGGGSLAAGGLGMAGGTAVLGGIVAGPIIAVGGMLMAAKAKANLADAKKKYAEAEKASEEMKTAASILIAITKLSIQFNDVISAMDCRMTIVLNKLESVLIDFENSKQRTFKFKVSKAIRKLFGKKTIIEYTELALDEKKAVQLAYQFAQTMKILLEKPLLTEDGTIDPKAEQVLPAAKEILAVPVA